VPRDFYLGKYEVTQEEWQAVMGSNPSQFSRQGDRKDAVKDVPEVELRRFPVENVSWEEAQQFLSRLNTREPESGWIYRLPTEEEWEYACRGGPSSDKADFTYDFYLESPGNQLTPAQANIGYHPNSLKRPCPVGSYKPNRLGLHDMHGNVFEWCDDGENDGKRAVRRSSGYGHSPEQSRAATRDLFEKNARAHDMGLRVARLPLKAESN
jgi:formylglycine-generating enzyme required for sulfatase activity